VHCPKDAGLAGLLTGTGGRFEGLLNGLAAAADPASGGSTTVTLQDGEAGDAAQALAALLERTPADHPARDKLAGIAAQLGAHL
jgi:hypothetical protein